MTWAQAMGRALRQRREELGLSRLALCADAGVSENHLLRFELGRQGFSLALLERVCLACGLSLAALACYATRHMELS